MAGRRQPLDLAYAPPRYPSHNYTGAGEIVAVRVGDELVGHLTRQEDAVGWLAAGNLSAAGDAVRVMVWEILSAGAREGRPLVDAWADCLDATQHDKPRTGPLDQLAG